MAAKRELAEALAVAESAAQQHEVELARWKAQADVPMPVPVPVAVAVQTVAVQTGETGAEDRAVEGASPDQPVLVAQAQRRAKELERELAAREAAHGCTVARLEAKLAKSVAEVHGGSEQRLAMQARLDAAEVGGGVGISICRQIDPRLRPCW
jgi:hypothetical protein